jgi:hypothetical protein
MNRREALERVAILTGAAVIGGQFFMSGCKRNPKQVNSLFNEDQVAFMNEVGDTILPETKTPGAKAADVGSFMAIMVQDCYSPADQKIFLAGLTTVDAEADKKYSKKFTDLDPAQRLELLTMLDKAQKAESKLPKPGKQYQYYAMLKQMTLLGYFTSEPGATKALRYIEVPGHFDGNYPYKKGDKAWAI